MKIDGDTTINELIEMAGMEFTDSLIKVVKIRVERRSVYGDSFFNEDLLGCYYSMKAKLDRPEAVVGCENYRDVISRFG